MAREKEVYLAGCRGRGTFSGKNAKVGFGKYGAIQSGEDCTWVHSWGNGYTIRGNWTDRNICEGVITYPAAWDRQQYEGRSRDGAPEGHGRMTYSNGDIYDGNWSMDKDFISSQDGFGTYTSQDGFEISGTWDPGHKNGLSRIEKWKEDENGYHLDYIYVGEVKGGIFNGYGRYCKNGGTILQGQWYNGQLDGPAKQIYEGASLEAVWKNGIMQSDHVKISFTNGSVYEGGIDQGKFTGQGRLTVPDSYTYEGEFQDSKFHGKGRRTESTGQVYDGEWKNGEKDGPGKLITVEGVTLEGIWKDDILQEELVRVYDPSGKLNYEGNFYGGQENGKGKSWFPDGQIYEGEFRDGVANGHGRIYSTDGTLFEGEFENSHICFDHFRMEQPDYYTFEGSGVDGKLTGHIHAMLECGVMDGEMVDGEMTENTTLTRDGETQKAKWKDGQWVFETPKSFIVIHFENMTPVVEELTKEMEDFQEEAQEAIETEGKYLTVSATNNDEYSEELRPYFDGLVGMDSVKSQIDKIYKRFKIDAMRQEMLGINAQKQGYYFIMSGNPGTGKTTVARIIAELLYRVGLLPSDSYVEVDRSKLVSQYVGETEKKTADAIEAARGGTLFIDEAYTLYKKDNANDPGGQAIDVLLKDMEDHRGEYCVIMAGYKKQMSEMVRNANPGLASRFDHHIEIPDYTAEELLQILVKMAAERHFYIESDARNRILEQIEREKVDETFDNARFSRRMFEAALEKQAERLSENIDNLKPEDLQVLKAEDFVPLKASSNKDYLKELDELIGLPGVKEEVRHLVNSAKILIESRNRGLDTADDVIPLNLVFTGNPGTGKTTVARILAKIYTQLGLLKRDDIFVECTRGDLVGEYQGHTAVKVREKVREALGGVLFIDEAYSLRIDDHDSFGLECVNALITEIENNRDKLAVIFAGYTNEMEAFLSTNPGLKSRMARSIEFTDYTDEELTKIFFFNMKKRGYTVNADEAFVTDFIAARSHTKDFGNARGVRNLCDDVLRNMKARLIASDDLSALTNEQLTEILPEDFS